MNGSFLPGLEPALPPSPAGNDGDGDEWYTPPHVVQAVATALGGIDVDPCAAPASPVKATHRIDVRKGGDGLRDQWPRGSAFVNPPYSNTGDWLQRCHAEAKAGRNVVALVPVRPETRAWWAHVWQAGAHVVQHRSRLRFVAPDGKTHGAGRMATAFICWHAPTAHKLAKALARVGIEAVVLATVTRGDTFKRKTKRHRKKTVTRGDTRNQRESLKT